MSKSILVIDTPENCAVCRLKIGLYCKENGNSIAKYFYNDKPNWCPLKPMPQSGNSLIDDCKEYYTDGWNDCLDEILGEEK